MPNFLQNNKPASKGVFTPVEYFWKVKN